MVELVLVFLLGVLSAGLVWLLLLPTVWRRIERLTRQRIERALPLNTNEILAERDRERAGFAVQRLALEARVDAALNAVSGAKAEVGQHVTREAVLLEKIAALESHQGQLGLQINALEAQAAERGASIARLTQAGEAARTALDHAEAGRVTLEARLAQVQLQLENERRLCDETEVHLHSARAAEDEALLRAQALRDELLSRQHSQRDDEARQAG